MIFRKFQCHDILEILIARKILQKCDCGKLNQMQETDLSIIDFFSSHSMELFEKLIKSKKFNICTTGNEHAAFLLSKITGSDIGSPEYEYDAIDYYNEIVEKGLRYLKTGDNSGLKACIKNFILIDGNNVKTFKITFVPQDIHESIKEWIKGQLAFREKLLDLHGAGMRGTPPTFEFQSNRFLERLKQLQNDLGRESVNLGLYDWGSRGILLKSENDDEIYDHPLNLTISDKSIVPLFMETQGFIDILDLSFVNSPLYPTEADIQFLVRYPCLTNLFSVDTQFLKSSVQKQLSESQIVILARIFEKLTTNIVFSGKPKLRNSFVDLIVWLMKKSTFCLEEASFLQDKALDFLETHANDRYTKTEDDFFLPFMLEKLTDEFGTDRVIKKPEKYNGEIDLLFDSSIPLELKVWKNRNSSKLEESVEAKFPQAGQAAAYAAINRLAFLLILDVSNPNKEITNLENCWETINLHFSNQKTLPTVVIAVIFHCNQPQPSKFKIKKD